MIYLTGSTNDVIAPALIAAGIGLMATLKHCRNLEAYPAYAVDNGCYRDTWEETSWLDWLATLPATDRCLFAVAPDVYPDARASLERGAEYFGVIRELGFPVAVVTQDGAERIDYPWEDFDVLFVGGARRDDPRDEWKVSPAAEGVCRAARNAGKWVHMGRVNSYRRLERARSMGCQSVDGTFIKHAPNHNLGRLDRFVRKLSATPPLPLDRWETPSHPNHRRVVAR